MQSLPQRASIRSWMSKTPVIGIPLDSNIADPVNGEEEDDNQSQEEDEGPMGSAGEPVAHHRTACMLASSFWHSATQHDVHMPALSYE